MMVTRFLEVEQLRFKGTRGVVESLFDFIPGRCYEGSSKEGHETRGMKRALVRRRFMRWLRRIDGT